MLSGHGDLAEVTSLIEARFAVQIICPHCQSNTVGSWGRACGLKRYRCRDCRKSFNALNGTPLARLHKREAWKTYAQAVADSVSVRKAARKSGVSVPTAFRWRHRFLSLAKDNKAGAVSGIVEAFCNFRLRQSETQPHIILFAISPESRRKGPRIAYELVLGLPSFGSH